jgi:hypothetical protein
MGDGLVEILDLTLCASLATAGVCSSQQDESKRSSPKQAKDSIPKQGGDQEQWRQHLAQAKQIFDAEAVRERSGDCTTASTTAEFDNCFDQRLEQNERNLEKFDGIIRQLQLGSPRFSAAHPRRLPDQPVQSLCRPSIGPNLMALKTPVSNSADSPAQPLSTNSMEAPARPASRSSAS